MLGDEFSYLLDSHAPTILKININIRHSNNNHSYKMTLQCVSGNFKGPKPGKVVSPLHQVLQNTLQITRGYVEVKFVFKEGT